MRWYVMLVILMAIQWLFRRSGYLIAQAISSESNLGQTLVIITTLVGAIGGVITAIGGILISMERIKSENERMRLARDDQVRGLREEMRLLLIQASQTSEGQKYLANLDRMRALRDQGPRANNDEPSPGGDFPDSSGDPSGQMPDMKK